MKKTFILFVALFAAWIGMVEGQTTISVPVSGSTDDAEELSSSEQNSSLDPGDIDLESSDLELVNDTTWNGIGQTIGIRFSNLDIPQGAAILEAYIEFGVKSGSTDAIDLDIKAELVSNALTFANTPNNISSRPTTTATVQWEGVQDWIADATGSTPDLSSLVSEVVSQEGWASGNSLAFIITGSGALNAHSFDGSQAPELIVKYIPVTTLSSSVAGSTDDAEELSATEQNSSLDPGDIDLESSDLELVDDTTWNGIGQTVGIRFSNLDIPQGAAIQEAYIEFGVKTSSTDAIDLDIKAEATDDATTFANTTNNISSRSTTTASVAWEGVQDWVAGGTGTTPDLTSIVSEVVTREGWASGNSLAFIITGSGALNAHSFDGSQAPALVVKYIPVATLSLPVASSTDDAEELSATEQNSTLNVGDVDLESSDLELVDDTTWNGIGQTVGIRFSGIELPQGALIQNAYIEFSVKAGSTVAIDLDIKAEATDNATTFANTTNNISSRSTTTASVAWEGVQDWVADGTGTTPDLSSVITEVVSREGWSTGNSLAFIITGSGALNAHSFDGSQAPKLIVSYLQGEIEYQPELVKEIPDKELVQGWDLSIDFTAFFRDLDSELTIEANVTGTDTLPTGLTLVDGILSGIFDEVGSFPITVTASSDGKSVSDEFTLEYIAPSGDFTLAIFHNNDGESDMLPDSIVINGMKTTGGSIGQFKATLDSLRKQAQDRGYESVMLSSGDNFLAGLEYNASQANGVYYDAIALDSINYDAICLGNHDFDFGTQILADLINSFGVNKAPYLSSNLSFENVPELQTLVDAGRIKSSTVLTKGGEEIGVIGLTTPLLPTISSPGNTIVSEAIVDSVQAEVDSLTNAGINKIILISHLQNYNEDIELASQVSGIDIIIAGGGDELLTNDPDLGAPYNTPVTDVYPVIAKDADENNIYIVTTPGNYRYVGNLLVDFDMNGVVSKVYQSDPVLVYGETDTNMVNVIEDPITEYIGDLSTNVIASVGDTLDYLREHLRGEETNGGNLFADAILWQAKKNAASFGVSEPQVAIQNSGGLRIESLVMPGDFTEDLTYEIAAFTNIVSVVEDIAPAKFLELIEHGVAMAPTLDGRFPQIAGFKVVYYQGEPTGEPGVKSIILDDGTVIVENGQVADDAPSLTLATIDFTAGGGDGYPFDPLTYTTLGTTYQQAFKNYLTDAEGLNGIISSEDYPYTDEHSRIMVEIYDNPAIQSVLLSEDFNGCPNFPPSGWTAYSVTSNKDWMCSEDGRGASGETGDYSAEVNGYGGDAASEDWLITPMLMLDDRGFFLNFNSTVRYEGPALEILYSMDYSGSGDPNTATWTNIQDAEDAVDENMDSYDFINSGDVNLEGISGEVYFAFKYTSTGTSSGQGAVYRIDDVVIKTDTLLYENFNAICGEENYAPEGWTVAEIGESGIVTCSSEGFENSADDYSLQCNGYGVGAGEVWVATPLLDLGSTDYVLTFASKVQYSGPMPTVLYSTDYSGVGDPNEATWTEITEASDAITTTFGKSPEIDLSFISEDAYVAFKYVSEGSNSGQSRIFLLDEVLISEPATIIEGGEVTIAEIQGEGEESPLVNYIVTTSGIVTAYFKDAEPYTGAGYTSDIEGFFMQDGGDDNDATSDGIYVYTDEVVAVGDSVTVRGLVTEYYGLTELNELESLEIVSSGNTVPEPISVDLPLSSPDHFERYEGMLVKFVDELTVTENRNLENYGEVRLSAEGLLYQPTQVVDPNDVDPEDLTAHGNSNVAAVNDYLDDIFSKSFLLDDVKSGSYPSPIPYLDDNGTLLAGSTVTDLTGILSYDFSEYRILPTAKPVFEYAEREPFPNFGDTVIKVASFNVLNYFNGDGQGGGFPTSRGAGTYEDFQKQTEKIVSALIEIDADVVGLMEIENDADDGYSAIKDLVDAINTELDAEVYDFVSTGIISPETATPDEIKVGFIYKTATIGLDGDYAILTNAFDPAFNDDYSRPALAQTFVETATSEKFTAVVNHLKSKSSGCDALGDPNDSDGQGNCNVTRTIAAGTLASWIETDPTSSDDEDFIIIGDLNSYAQEDPIDSLLSRGYVNLVKDNYSYVYDGQYGTLDYAMANQEMSEKVTKTFIWHINSIEPDMFAYNGDEDQYAADPYASSDHDPVIVGVKLDWDPTGVVISDELRQINLYPVPFTDEIHFYVEVNDAEEITFEVFNTTGVKVYSNQHTLTRGTNRITEDFSWLERGMYIVKVKELQFNKVIMKQ